MIGHYDQLLKQLESNLLRQAKLHDPKPVSCCRLSSSPELLATVTSTAACRTDAVRISKGPSVLGNEGFTGSTYQ